MSQEVIETESFAEFTAAVANARSRGLDVQIISPAGGVKVYRATADDEN